MEDLYLWGTAIVVGIAGMVIIPAKKLSKINRRLRSRIPGVTLILLYAIICALFFVSGYFLCLAFKAPLIVRNIVLGVLIGLAIALVPMIDKRNSGEDEDGK